MNSQSIVTATTTNDVSVGVTPPRFRCVSMHISSSLPFSHKNGLFRWNSIQRWLFHCETQHINFLYVYYFICDAVGICVDGIFSASKYFFHAFFYIRPIYNQHILCVSEWFSLCVCAASIRLMASNPYAVYVVKSNTVTFQTVKFIVNDTRFYSYSNMILLVMKLEKIEALNRKNRNHCENELSTRYYVCVFLFFFSHVLETEQLHVITWKFNMMAFQLALSASHYNCHWRSSNDALLSDTFCHPAHSHRM